MVRKDTLWDTIRELNRRRKLNHEINEELKFTSFVTSYGQTKKTYMIERIDFERSPNSTFTLDKEDRVISFADYFKEKAIPYAYEFVTDVLGIDPERLWYTVYETDDEAEEIWIDAVGVPADRVQRGGKDHFWQMGVAGPWPFWM